MTHSCSNDHLTCNAEESFRLLGLGTKLVLGLRNLIYSLKLLTIHCENNDFDFEN